MTSTDRPASPDRRDTPDGQARLPGTGRHLVAAAGALDPRTPPHSSPAPCDPCCSPTVTSVLVDLSGVVFLDPTGLTCLIAACRTARNTGARPALIAPGGRVRRMPALTGTDQALHSHPTPDSVPDGPTG